MLNIGITSFNILSVYDLIPTDSITLFFTISVVLFTTDYAIKFFIYLMVNRHFFEEFKKIFKNGLNSSIVATSLKYSTTK